MKITIAPASTQTGAAVIRSLLTFSDRNIEITALYRDLKKVPDEFTSHSHFNAMKADVGDASSLNFSDADAVLAITPPAFDDRDMAKHAERVSNNVRNAVEKAGSVKRLVLLSSMGAEFDHGVVSIVLFAIWSFRVTLSREKSRQITSRRRSSHQQKYQRSFLCDALTSWRTGT
jgi:hypothetical protein